MKRFLTLTMATIALLFSACSGDYDYGFEDGYDNGYENGKTDGYNEASTEYDWAREEYEDELSRTVDEVYSYFVPPEDFAEEIGTSYDDFMAYYSWLFENVYSELNEYYWD